MSTLRTVRERFGAKREWHVGPGANLRGANFRSVDLRGLDLSGCDLTDAIFNEADLTGVCLDDATLCDAVLFRTTLNLATALRANFSGAILREANLRGADFSSAVLDPGACEGAFGDESTQLPEGHDCVLGGQGDNEQLGDVKLGGYRRLPMMLEDGAAPQPFIEPGSLTVTAVTATQQNDLFAGVVRILNETLQVHEFHPADEYVFEPDQIDLWYRGRVRQGGGQVNPYVLQPLARLLANVLNFTFEEIHGDGSVTATVRPLADSTEVLIREILAPNYLSIAVGLDAPDIEEGDETCNSVEEICLRFDELVDEGFDRDSITRYRLKVGRRKVLVATLDQSEGDTVSVHVEATEFGAPIATHIWSVIEGEGDDPATANVARDGWSAEFELNPLPAPIVDAETFTTVRELYSPVSIAGCGEIVAFEHWENDLTMAKVRLWTDDRKGTWPSSAELEPRDAIRAILENAVSAYLCTKFIDDDRLVEIIYGDEESAEDDEVDRMEDEDDGELEDEEESEEESEEVEVVESLRDELDALVAEMRAAGTQVEGVWCGASGEWSSTDLLPEELIAESRWDYMMDAARNGVLFVRSQPALFEALGISEAMQLDARSFRVRMKPRVSARFHRNYEWVPPSQWNG